MRRSLALAALCLGLAVAAARPAGAATFAATTVEEVARTSDAVVRGRVVAVAARSTRDGRIVSDVEIAVDEAWKGAPDPVVRVVVPGGRLPHLAMRVDAAPEFEPGEEVVVFLARGAKGWHVNGLAQGKFRVEAGGARPASEAAAVLPRAAPLPPGERQVGPMPVSELERRVRAAR
jgi:hypothetical protein